MTINKFIREKKRNVSIAKCRRSTLVVIFCLSVFLLSIFVHSFSSPLSAPFVQNGFESNSKQTPNIKPTLGSDFCQKIIEDPEPWHVYCDRDVSTMRCRNHTDKFLMFSQHKQDWFFYTQHFKKLKRPGFYLDIATNDPVYISNTFFLDKCLNWKGVCVEANRVYADRIRRYRSCEFIPTCISRNDGEVVRFGKHSVRGGILGSTYKFGERFDNDTKHTEELRCTNVSTVLTNNGVREIDFLSLDVEGHELVTLQGIDWTKTIIKVMSIETSFDEIIENKIGALLEPLGYKRYAPKNNKMFYKGRIGQDIVFLHKDVEFGNPV